MLFKWLKRRYEAPLLNRIDVLRGKVHEYSNYIDVLEFELSAVNSSKAQAVSYEFTIEEQLKTINGLREELKQSIASRKYAGAKYYDPDDHKKPTVWVCAAWGDWYIVNEKDWIQPKLMHRLKFDNEAYPGYVKQPKLQDNRKFVK